MKVCVGGTFNALHRGHHALLDKAFEIGDEVIIGITSDVFAASRRSVVRPLCERKNDVIGYLRSRGYGPYTLIVIDDAAGGMATRKDISALIVSPATRSSGDRINDERSINGLPPLDIVVVPFEVAKDFLPISSTRVLSGEIDREGELLRPLRIGVGSDNPVKISAVKNVLGRYYSSVDIQAYKVITSVPEQPLESETRQGAICRAKAAIRDNDIGVGLEAGVFRTEDGLYDVQYCAIVDRSGNTTVGHGPGFRYPPEVEHKVLNGGETVGKAFRELYGCNDEGREDGAIGYLTKGTFRRTELTEQAVLAAFVPRIRPELYR